MGADFCFMALKFKKAPNWSKGTERIEKLSTMKAKDWGEDWINYYNGDSDFDTKEAVTQLKADLESLKRYFDGRTREVGILYDGKSRWLLTGGMTWGDSPTEAYSVFERLTYSGVARACGFTV